MPAARQHGKEVICDETVGEARISNDHDVVLKIMSGKSSRHMEAAATGSLSERTEALAAKLYSVADEADASGAIAASTLQALHLASLPSAPFDRNKGGEDLLEPKRIQDLLLVLKAMGGADLSLARLVEGHVNAVALVARYGTKQQGEAFSRAVSAGALSGVWGADDAKGLHARPTPGGWVLEGRKILASGAGILRQPLVTASTEAGQVLFLLEMKPGERADLSSWTAQGMRSSATGSVDLTGMTLSADRLIGRPGDFTRQPYFSGGAWRFCAVHLGAMEKLVDLFREHLVSRNRGGDAYQLQRVAQCITSVTTSRFWVDRIASLMGDDKRDPDEIVALANLTRMVTERCALDVLEAVHRGVGLMAFIRPNPIERISRDLSTYLRQPVPDLAMSDAAQTILASARRSADLWTL